VTITQRIHHHAVATWLEIVEAVGPGGTRPAVEVIRERMTTLVLELALPDKPKKRRKRRTEIRYA